MLVSRLSDLVKNRINKDSQEINLKIFDLIVVDDIGTENSTQTAYNIIDDIYRYNIPLIVTTNLAPSELKNPDLTHIIVKFSRHNNRMCFGVDYLYPGNAVALAEQGGNVYARRGLHVDLTLGG